jgi:hypothetical protein
MRLEVGIDYRTRGGRRATIRGRTGECGIYWGYFGSACDVYKEWDFTGAHRYGSSEFDIISEWKGSAA